jgi:acetoin utilization protein AcuB
MIVSDVMQTRLPVLAPETELESVFPEDYPSGMPYAPVVREKEFLGFLFLDDLEAERDSFRTVGEAGLEKTDIRVDGNLHIFQVVPLFHKAGLPVLPVVDEKKEYSGVVLQEAVISFLSQSYSFSTDGAVLVMSVPFNSYSLAEIARLVESNQAKILSSLVESDPHSGQDLLIHFKLNVEDASRVVATLERFGYQVLDVFHKTETTSLDQERLDQLFKYLGM